MREYSRFHAGACNTARLCANMRGMRGSGDFERGEEGAVVGAGDVFGFQIAHIHALVVHDVVDFGDRACGRVGHVRAFAGLFAGVQEAVAEQVSEAGVVPGGVEIAHQYVQVGVHAQLGDRVEAFVPQALVAGARGERVHGAETHLAAGEADGGRRNAAGFHGDEVGFGVLHGRRAVQHVHAAVVMPGLLRGHGIRQIIRDAGGGEPADQVRGHFLQGEYLDMLLFDGVDDLRGVRRALLGVERHDAGVAVGCVGQAAGHGA